ncbi:adenine phosphoribosyltransferase [Candidatus Bathyarchaeota archaeon]|nr:adenine phosphoribosyltransferase [Candidatus Bathyarchaeota archaeon]MBS7631509.1 adenine phosphoribosyltransferase [Candidatus Bathyarchaeota archaeon]
METRVRELKYRMMITDLLKVASESHTYQELSSRLGLSPPILSRYMRGHVLPSYDRAQGLYEKLMEITNIREELKKRISFDEEGYFDNTPLVSEITWLKIMSNYAMEKFAGTRITRVLTAAVDGIPVSTLVSNLLEVDLVVAKETKEVGINDFLEQTYVLKGSAIKKSLYVPRPLIRKRDSVLIIDDVVRSGETVKALVDLVKEQKADVAGIYVLVTVGEEWKRHLKDIINQYAFEVLIRL